MGTSAKIHTPAQERERPAIQEKQPGKGKSKPVPAVDTATAAVSICEGRGALTAETAGIAMPASDETDEIPKSDIRSWLMDTGCKHDLTTRGAIPLCQLGVITNATIPVLLSTAYDIFSS